MEISSGQPNISPGGNDMGGDWCILNYIKEKVYET